MQRKDDHELNRLTCYKEHCACMRRARMGDCADLQRLLDLQVDDQPIAERALELQQLMGEKLVCFLVLEDKAIVGTSDVLPQSGLRMATLEDFASGVEAWELGSREVLLKEGEELILTVSSEVVINAE